VPRAQKGDVTFSPMLAAAAGAAFVAAVIAFVLRPAQLAPAAPPALAAPRVAEPVVASPPPALVYVAGAVRHPGVYALPAGSRARDALALAGGPAGEADLVAVNLAARVADGDEIAVPLQGEARTAPRARTAHRSTSGTSGRRRRRPRHDDAAPAAESPVDLNSADQRTLGALPGIGPELAARIVAFRAVNGPFASVDGLADVAGITPRRLDALAPLLTAGR
jgi:competence protein ComEA